jgi:hypothetical protein
VGVGQPSSSVLKGTALASATDIGFSDQISGSPRVCGSAAISVAMLRATMEGQISLRPLWVWKASSSGQCFYLETVWVNEACAMVPRAPLSLIICVHELMADVQ